eukprot:59796-Pleurochrysis_carterae.AAC.1
MTKPQLLNAYMRLLVKRNCAESKVRRLSRELDDKGGASSSSLSNRAAPMMRVRKTTVESGESSSSLSKAVVDARRRRLSHRLQSMLDARPPADHAHAIDILVQNVSSAQRETLRKLPSVQQGRFLASRDLCATLRSQHITPTATLT